MTDRRVYKCIMISYHPILYESKQTKIAFIPVLKYLLGCVKKNNIVIFTVSNF